MRTAFAFASVVLLATAATAQVPRASIDPEACGQITFDPQIATEGEISILAFSGGITGTAQRVHVYSSNGQGLKWSGPVILDTDATGARKDMDDPTYLQVEGGVAYVIWEDERGTDQDIYFSRSTDGGATWSTEKALDKAGMTGDAFGPRMAVSGPCVYIAFTVDNGGNNQLVLVTSTDAGTTLSSASFISSIGSAAATEDVDELNLRADLLDLHVAWADNRAGADDVYYRRSTDGGISWTGPEVLIDSTGAGVGDQGEGLRMALDGNLVAVSWGEETTGTGNESVYVNVSTDGGASFGGAQIVGGYADQTDDSDNHRLMVSGGNVIVTYEDNRTGADQIYASTSTDGGATWNETPALGGGGFPRVSNVSSSDEDVVAIAWTGTAFPEDALFVTSLDNGVSWIGPIAVNDTPGDADFSEFRWNSLYNNFLVAWLSDECPDGLGGAPDGNPDNGLFVGGYRPQTMTANGWVPGNTSVNFSFENFDVSTCDSAWALVNLAGPGVLLIPDGRDLGLVGDPLIASSVALAGAGLASALLDGSGAGSTIPIPITLPAGITFYAVGAGIDTGGGGICDLTDVVTITL